MERKQNEAGYTEAEQRLVDQYPELSDIELIEAQENMATFPPATSDKEELAQFASCLEGTKRQYHPEA